MFCTNCGHNCGEGMNFCTQCGNPLSQKSLVSEERVFTGKSILDWVRTRKKN